MPSAAFTTLGCKVNQYETQRILESFEVAGFAIVPFGQPADVTVINTCSVTATAESKSRATLRRARRASPGGRVVATGCAVQMAMNHGRTVPDVDLAVGHDQKLATLFQVGETWPQLVQDAAAYPAQLPPPQGRTRATLKVQDGCNVMCSYCSIPFTRPGMRSRPAHEVLAEARELAARGYGEIVLTGVLIGAYGPETGSEGPDFEALVATLANESGVPRIRISSIELGQVTDRLIELVEAGRVVPHLHVPLQSGDTQVLRDMNRPYTQTDYLQRCATLRKRCPSLSITTDILVGFPTEDAARFEGSVTVTETVGFLKSHVFSFSPRPGTPADRWGDPVTVAEKDRRRERLMAAAQVTGDAVRHAFVGRTVRVLVEGRPNREGLLEGLSDFGFTVRFTGPLNLTRQFAWVQLGQVVADAVHGELVAVGLTPPVAPLPVLG